MKPRARIWKLTPWKGETPLSRTDTEQAPNVGSLTCSGTWYQYHNRRFSHAPRRTVFPRAQGPWGSVCVWGGGSHFILIHSKSLKFTLKRNWIFKVYEVGPKLWQFPLRRISFVLDSFSLVMTWVNGFDQGLDGSAQSSVPFFCHLGSGYNVGN